MNIRKNNKPVTDAAVQYMCDICSTHTAYLAHMLQKL